MEFYFNDRQRISRVDKYNLMVEETIPVVSQKTNETYNKWITIGYYPNLFMAFKHYILKEVHEEEVVAEFKGLLRRVAFLYNQYQKLAKQLDTVEKQNEEIIEQNKKIIKLKQKELDKELTLEYNEQEIEEEVEGWNY